MLSAYYDGLKTVAEIITRNNNYRGFDQVVTALHWGTWMTAGMSFLGVAF